MMFALAVATAALSGTSAPPTIFFEPGTEVMEVFVGANPRPKLPPVTATDEKDGDLTHLVRLQGKVDFSTTGTYTLTYSVSDSDGNTASRVRKVYVDPAGGTAQKVAVTPEMVSLPKGTGDPLALFDGNTETGWGSTNGGRTLPHTALVSLPSMYRLSRVSYYDANGVSPYAFTVGYPTPAAVLFNESTAQYRTWIHHDVDVTARFVGITKYGQASINEVELYGYPVPDRRPPVLSLNGPREMVVQQGGRYYELGAAALDDFDGDLTQAVAIADAVDTSVPGVYYVVYTVEDSSGNVAVPVTREVRVVSAASSCPAYPELSDLTHEQRIWAEKYRIVLSPRGSKPPVAHPRLFGTDAEWLRTHQRFSALSCGSGERAGRGTITNARQVWERLTRGATWGDCEPSGTLRDVATVPFAKAYLDGAQRKEENALKVLHLLRRELHCHRRSPAAAACDYSLSSVESLLAAFVQAELAFFPSQDWHHGYSGEFFDLGARPAFRYWCIFLDVLWDERAVLPTDARQPILDKMSSEIDSFMTSFRTGHWSVHNGNNWTPMLGLAATYWGILLYHEDDRAPVVLEMVLESMWLHREFHLDDGSYGEGVLQYADMAVSCTVYINWLIEAGFGESLDSPNWTGLRKAHDWLLWNMATDGRAVDFGDSWAVQGFGVPSPVLSLFVVPGAAPDACAVRRFFQNNWYDVAFDDVWNMHPLLAQDYASLVASCTKVDEGLRSHVFPQGVTGVLQMWRSGVNAEVPISSEVVGTPLKLSQAEATHLTVNGFPNRFPHRELDFGAVVWVAWGSRLLADFGYAGIVNSYGGGAARYRREVNPDYLPSFTNTVAIPEAVHPDDPDTDMSQLFGATGRIESGDAMHHMIGDEVYAEWLSSFDRWTAALPDGSFIVVDAFRVRSDRPAASVTEHWVADGTTEVTAQGQAASLVAHNGLRDGVVGTMAAASMRGGAAFAFDGKKVIKRAERILFRYAPAVPVDAGAADVRLFLLSASPVGSNPPAASVVPLPSCSLPDGCFRVTTPVGSYVVSVDLFTRTLTVEQ